LQGDVLGIMEVNFGIFLEKTSKDAANLRIYGDMVDDVPGNSIICVQTVTFIPACSMKLHLWKAKYFSGKI
jgi:hypothetical protein